MPVRQGSQIDDFWKSMISADHDSRRNTRTMNPTAHTHSYEPKDVHRPESRCDKIIIKRAIKSPLYLQYSPLDPLSNTSENTASTALPYTSPNRPSSSLESSTYKSQEARSHKNRVEARAASTPPERTPPPVPRKSVTTPSNLSEMYGDNQYSLDRHGCSSNSTDASDVTKTRQYEVSELSAQLSPEDTNRIDRPMSREAKDGTSHKISEPANVDNAADTQWHLSDIPPELKLTEKSTPALLRVIMEEFWGECQAIQASACSEQERAMQQADRDARTPSIPDSSELVTEAQVLPDSQIYQNMPHPSRSSTASQHLPIQGTSISDYKTSGPLLRAVSRMIKGKKAIRESVVHAPIFRECSSCFDDIPLNSSIDLSCQHSYCSDCFAQLVLAAMKTESLWPPRCCLEEIPRAAILQHLSEQQVLEFGAKEKEYRTPANERWYCTNTKCLKFFVPSKHSTWTVCTHCKHNMCIHCRGPRHPTKERCPQDKDLQATLNEAELAGWRACYSCQNMIELTQGCRHITCTCGAQFCYTCGARWKTCRCTEIDQVQRQRNLAAARAAAQKRREVEREEEAALQADIEAIAEQERKEVEQRLLEERRQIVRIESERVAGITAYYNHLRTQLQDLQQMQRQHIEQRHESTLANLEFELANIKVRQQKLEKRRSQQGESVESVHQQWQRQVFTDFVRHHQYQAALLDSFQDCSNKEDMSARASEIEDLILIQEKQRKVRDDRFARKIAEIEKGTQADDSNRLHSKTTESREAEIEQARQQIEVTRENFETEGKWVDFARTECLSLINEDEVHFIQTGADAPPTGVEPATAQHDHQPAVTRERPVSDSSHIRGIPAITFEAPKSRSSRNGVAESSAMGAKRHASPVSPMEAYFSHRSGWKDKMFGFNWP